MPGSCQAILLGILFNYHNNSLVESLLISYIRRLEQNGEGTAKATTENGGILDLVAGNLAAVFVKGSKFGLRHIKFEVFLDKAEHIYRSTVLMTVDENREESSSEMGKWKKGRHGLHLTSESSSFYATEPTVTPPWLLRAILLGSAPGESPLTNDQSHGPMRL